MRVIEAGHIFGLRTHDGKEHVLTFVKSLPEGDPTNHDGVMCQEVDRALLSRELELFSQWPCHETTEIIILRRQILSLYEQRAFRHTLDKSYRKCGLHIEQLPVHENGHVFSLTPERPSP